VPAAYVNSLPPASGKPSLSKNCQPAPPIGDRLTAIMTPEGLTRRLLGQGCFQIQLKDYFGLGFGFVQPPTTTK
jgi:hypothetical protein